MFIILAVVCFDIQKMQALAIMASTKVRRGGARLVRRCGTRVGRRLGRDDPFESGILSCMFFVQGKRHSGSASQRNRPIQRLNVFGTGHTSIGTSSRASSLSWRL